MKEYIHPSIPLTIVNEHILGPDGVVGYVNCGESYVYVCFFNSKLVVAEHNGFDSIMTRLISDKIREKYYYAFKILCGGGVTAVVNWLDDDIALVGVTSGHLTNGERIWRPADEITWPGIKV